MAVNQWNVGVSSIYRLLLGQLQAAIGSEFEPIPLQRARDKSRSLYSCAIALKLGPLWERAPMDIATELAARFQELRVVPPYSENLGDFTIEVVPPGLILFELRDAALVAWLQYLVQTPLQDESDTAIQAEHPLFLRDRLFPIQYSHARCCSLLRLAHRDRIVVLAHPDPNSSLRLWRFLTPDPIPWLDYGARLRLVHPAEYNLISQLLTALDAIATGGGQGGCDRTDKSVRYLNLARDLSQAFQVFYSQCQIWGDVKLHQPELAQARLGLVAATQSLLGVFLRDFLGAVAPMEL